MGDVLRTRTLLRGAMMNALVEAAGGSNSILATSGAFHMVCDPFKFLKLDGDDRESRVQGRILSNRDTRIPDLTHELICHFNDHPLLLGTISALGAFVTKNTWVLASDTLRPQPPPTPLPPPLQKNGCQTLMKGQASKVIPTDLTTSKFNCYLPIALILREACNRARNLGAADEKLHQLLQGLGPDGTQVYLPEHMDPIRATNAYRILMQTHLPAAQLTSATGISAILAYMGSGQSSATSGFLEAHGECFWDHKKCYDTFKSVSEQASVTAIKYQNPGVWGQTCSHLRFVKDGDDGFLKDRVAKAFSPEVQGCWVKWLGGLVGKDPADISPTQQKSWEETYKFITTLGITGFSSGLTPLQFTNSLALAGITKEPTLEEMKVWVCAHPKKGACSGLEFLGFKLKGPGGKREKVDIGVAFDSVYRFLDQHLSAEDKSHLHFGAMFVEHALCKVSRWEARSSGALSGHGVEAGDWIPGENTHNKMAFPIPVISDI